VLDRLAGRLLNGGSRPPDDGRKRAAVAVVLHAGRVLLMKRVERAGDPWSGHISLPGGGFAPGDGDLRTTAIRETREELGLDLDTARMLGHLKPLAPMTSGPMGIEVTPFVFATDVPLEPQCGPEAEAAFWLSLELAASGALDDMYTYPGTTRTFPSWRYEQYVIWGLTRRILDDLLALAK
jgi:8-oxo-dGTP pyrophosphatase MutT (NUDIX family)